MFSFPFNITSYMGIPQLPKDQDFPISCSDMWKRILYTFSQNVLHMQQVKLSLSSVELQVELQFCLFKLGSYYA